MVLGSGRNLYLLVPNGVNFDEEDGPDDSDITPAEVVADVIGEETRRHIVRHKDGGGLSSAADTDNQELVESSKESEVRTREEHRA